MIEHRVRTAATAIALLLIAGVGAGCTGGTPPAAPNQSFGPAAAPPVAAPAVVAAPSAVAPPAAAPVVATPSSVADLVDAVAPTVVNITAIQQRRPEGVGMPVDPFEFFFGRPEGGTGPRLQLPPQQSAGTGFLIDAKGHVVTNEHVVRGADEVRVRLFDEREFAADVVGRDRKLDVALLELKGASSLPVAALGSSTALRVGEQVLAVGNPFGLGHTVTMGIVSAKARTIGAGPYDEFIQTDAAINPGNSGGPLFNLRGEVVGINTVIRGGAEGIGFAIPIDAVRAVLGQLEQKGFVERGKLGLAFQTIDDDLAKALGLDRPRGALVTDVEPGAAAARAGIREGDIVVSVNGMPITHSEELPRNVARNAPGTTIDVGIERQGQRLSVRATLDKLDDDEGSAPIRRKTGAAPSATQSMQGIEVDDAPGGGARIVGLTPERAASGLQVGDVVVQVGRTPIRDGAQLRSVMGQLSGGSSALLKVKRGKRSLFVGIPIGR